MPSARAKLITVVLLVLQVAVALAPGRVLCVAMGDHNHHMPRGASACGHCPSHGRSHEYFEHQADGHATEHSAAGLAHHGGGSCDCHAHVLVPSNEHIPQGGRGSSLGTQWLADVPAAAITLRTCPGLPLNARTPLHPPNASALDQYRALRTTRLVI